ncbi:MAG: YceI family protein [Vicingaceae bacterium]
MKKVLSIASMLLITTAMYAGGTKAKELKVNNKISSIEWIGKKVTGQHEGTIKVKEGLINVEDGNLSNGMLVIDMSSIIITDIKDPETNAKLAGHLNSDDFFGVENHPTATLKINSTKKVEGENYIIMADLTIKGHTEKVEIPATIKMEEDKVVAVGEVEIDRTKFGIRYGSGSFFDDLGDKAIYDNFTVKFKVGATS